MQVRDFVTLAFCAFVGAALALSFFGLWLSARESVRLRAKIRKATRR